MIIIVTKSNILADLYKAFFFFFTFFFFFFFFFFLRYDFMYIKLFDGSILFQRLFTTVKNFSLGTSIGKILCAVILL